MNHTTRELLDTNVLVYSLDASTSEAAKQRIAQEVLARRDVTLVISTQVLQELYVATTRKISQPLSEEEASKVVEDLSRLPLVQIDADAIAAGIRRSRRYQLSLWDAMIVQAAVESSCGTILSEELQDESTIDGVKIVDPFRA